jgi:hypothetical protein
MIKKFSENQNWAKLAPILGVLSAVLLFMFFKPSQAMFWALVNIPLYFFHQTEEHLWPGGFKNYINRVVNKLPAGEEALTDEKVFWINILLVWAAFILFGCLAFLNIGFGLLIIIFSIINCLTHIAQAFKQKEWNPGLVMASLQFLLSIYAAYFVTMNGLTHQIYWWIGTIIFSVAVHVVLFKVVMSKS